MAIIALILVIAAAVVLLLDGFSVLPRVNGLSLGLGLLVLAWLLLHATPAGLSG